jgi:hypothetical protein
VGGELLTIEAAIMPGKGRMTVTGNLRDVMRFERSLSLKVWVRRGRSRAEVDPAGLPGRAYPQPTFQTSARDNFGFKTVELTIS